MSTTPDHNIIHLFSLVSAIHNCRKKQQFANAKRQKPSLALHGSINHIIPNMRVENPSMSTLEDNFFSHV